MHHGSGGVVATDDTLGLAVAVGHDNLEVLRRAQNTYSLRSCGNCHGNEWEHSAVSTINRNQTDTNREISMLIKAKISIFHI